MLESIPDRGGDPDRPGKKDPLDCVCCGAARATGEPSWESPWGPGRPGWHVECTRDRAHHLGAGVRRAGRRDRPGLPAPRDVRRPRAGRRPRAPVRPGLRARRRWSAYDGEKMSKSRGNLVFVSHLRNSDVDPMAIRLALMRHHYRTTGSGPTRSCWAPSTTWPPGARRSRWGRRPRRTGGGGGARRAWRPTSTPRRALAAVDGWVAATLGTDGLADTSDPDACDDHVRALLDAALGLRSGSTETAGAGLLVVGVAAALEVALELARRSRHREASGRSVVSRASPRARGRSRGCPRPPPPARRRPAPTRGRPRAGHRAGRSPSSRSSSWPSSARVAFGHGGWAT